MRTIDNFSSFLDALDQVGFSTSGAAAPGGVALSDWFAPNIRWHTGEDTDPWRWRVRVLTDRRDIAYGKFFLNNGGFVTREWYARFVAVRREGRCLDELYAEGLIPRDEVAIYRAIETAGDIDVHALKRALSIPREGNGRFEAALARLQMRMLVAVSGEARFLDKFGQPYGWAINRYQTSEVFFGPEVDAEATALDPREAACKIAARIREVHPDAPAQEIARFVGWQGPSEALM